MPPEMQRYSLHPTERRLVPDTQGDLVRWSDVSELSKPDCGDDDHEVVPESDLHVRCGTCQRGGRRSVDGTIHWGG
jgi:hypothetical protein